MSYDASATVSKSPTFGGEKITEMNSVVSNLAKKIFLSTKIFLWSPHARVYKFIPRPEGIYNWIIIIFTSPFQKFQAFLYLS